MTIKNILEKLSHSENLYGKEAEFAMNEIMSGKVSSEQVAGFLTAMRIKGETNEELTAFVKVMRDKALKVDVNVDGAIDLVGTGGDKSGTFNISTIASFIVAGAGVPVIKHGNRSASSKCGSADVLEKLGAVIELDQKQVAQVYNEVGLAFMYAPMFHPAMKYVMPARKALGFRTFFNILGPMCNPAGVKRYVIGAYNKSVAEKMAHILANLGTDFAYTFSADDGLDEVSLTAQSLVYELKDNVLSRGIVFTPESIGFERVTLNDLMGGEAETNAAIFRQILGNSGTKAQQDMVLLNATFAIQASGKVDTLQEAKELAEDSLKSGKAEAVLHNFIDATQQANN